MDKRLPPWEVAIRRITTVGIVAAAALIVSLTLARARGEPRQVVEPAPPDQAAERVDLNLDAIRAAGL